MKSENTRLSFVDNISLILATWFGSGYLPKAPGTWGTLAALPLVAAMMYFDTAYIYLALAVVITLVSIPIAHSALRVYQNSENIAQRNPHQQDAFNNKLMQSMIKGADGQAKDPGMIVIDEVAGMAVTMCFLPLNGVALIGGFFAFRIFDIFKFFPARQLENVGGGAGIVLDDVAAGVYACLATHLGYYLYNLMGLPLF